MLQTTYKKVVKVEGETPAGPINGSNQTFVTSMNIKPGSLAVYLNGLRQKEGTGFDYVVSGLNMIVMETAPLPGDVLLADYIKL